MTRRLPAAVLSLVLGAALACVSTADAAQTYGYDPACPPAAAPAASTHPTRVMITGDSMSNGFSGDWTWRYQFDKHLVTQGVNVDLVGTLSDVVDPVSGSWWRHAYVVCRFDQDHEARVGAQLASWLYPPYLGTEPVATTVIAQKVAAMMPDVVVEFLGFNDLTRPRFGQKAGRPYTIDELITNVTKYVAQVRLANPAATVVLTTLASHETDPKRVYSARLKALAASLDAPGQRVVVADALKYWAGTSDTWDGYHPNSRGETHIAQAMADAFALLGLGKGAATIPKAAPIGPRTAPKLKAVAAVGKLTLTWAAIPGVTRVLVYCREPSVSATWSRHHDVTITTAASSNGVRLTTCRGSRSLVKGHRYQVYVRAAKGTSVAADIASQTLARTVPRH